MFQAGKFFLMASAMSLAALPAPVLAKDDVKAATSAEAQPETRLYNEKMQRQVQEGIAWVEEIFGLQDLPPVDESRLPAARAVASAISQRESVEQMFDGLYGRAFKNVSHNFARVKPSELSIAFGLSAADAEKVSRDDLKAVAAILDPQRDARDARMKAIAQPIVDLLLDTMVPRIQEGQARALARRFTADQLADIGKFLQTPAGAAFGAQLLPLNADPELMAAMVKAVPDVLPRLEDVVKPAINNLESLPVPQDLKSLSDADLRKVAKILKMDFKTLKAQIAANKAEEEKAAETFAAETRSYKAYDRENWSAERRAEVEALEAAATAAQDAARTAETAAIDDASARLGSGSPPTSAQ